MCEMHQNAPFPTTKIKIMGTSPQTPPGGGTPFSATQPSATRPVPHISKRGYAYCNVNDLCHMKRKSAKMRNSKHLMTRDNSELKSHSDLESQELELEL